MADDSSFTGHKAGFRHPRDLHETSQDRFHLIDFSLLAGNDLTAKFLDFRILDGRPLTHENSPPHDVESWTSRGLCRQWQPAA